MSRYRIKFLRERFDNLKRKIDYSGPDFERQKAKELRTAEKNLKTAEISLRKFEREIKNTLKV